MKKTNEFRCGYVAIVGRPNVGKSTLLNHLVGQKISITASKPQTTRHRILGIKTTETYQAIYIDTPGIHKKTPRELNRYMNRTANHSLWDVDLIVFMVAGLTWRSDDEWAWQKIQKAEVPVLLVVNKVDKIADKSSLLPYLETLAQKGNFAAIIPMSAKNETDVKMLEATISQYLPAQAAIFAADQITDRSERFLVAEIIREQLTRLLGQELPYALTVEIEQYKEEDKLLRIAAVIYVDKASQKAIVIGEKGAVLKKVGQRARLEIQKWVNDQKVFLQLWVKVKQGWADDERSLRSLGYGD